MLLLHPTRLSHAIMPFQPGCNSVFKVRGTAREAEFLKGTRASLERILEENGVVATILENVPHEGIYQVDVHDPPTWLADMLDEVHPAGTKWVYVVNWNSVRQLQITPETAMARIEIRTSTSSMAASGYVEITTS